MKKFLTVFILVLAAALLMTGCAGGIEPQGDENPGVEGGDFVEQESIADSLAAADNTTVTLTGDESIDLTGVTFTGRKEIFTNGHTLTLTGQYAVTTDAVLDIKPGEGTQGDAIDMSALTFDTSAAPAALDMELSLIEIRPGVEIVPPQTGNGIFLQEFPDVLTFIGYFPEE